MVGTKPANLALIIDSREHKLITELTRKKIKFQVETMEVGDVAIRHAGGAYWLLLERKTWFDLSQSYTDCRHADQRRRLRLAQQNEPRAAVGYLIEGGLPPYNMGARKLHIGGDKLRAAVAGIQFRDNMCVVRTVNLQDTADTLKILFSKMRDNGSTWSAAEQPKIQSPRPSAPPLLSKTQVNQMQNSCFARQLMCVQRVSYDVAKTIIKRYRTPPELRRALRVKGAIANLRRVSGSKAKLGPALELHLSKAFY